MSATTGARVSCGCPICASSKAMRILEAAHNAWVEHGGDQETNFYFLRDAVEESLAMKGRKAKRHLKEALATIDRGPHLDWMNAVPSVRHVFFEPRGDQ